MLVAFLGRRLIVQSEGHAAHAIGPTDFNGEGVTLRPADTQSRRQPGLDEQDESHEAQYLGGVSSHWASLMAAPRKRKPCAAPRLGEMRLPKPMACAPGRMLPRRMVPGGDDAKCCPATLLRDREHPVIQFILVVPLPLTFGKA